MEQSKLINHNSQHMQLIVTLMFALSLSMAIILISNPIVYTGVVLIVAFMLICVLRPFYGLLIYYLIAFQTQIITIRVYGLLTNNILLLILLFGFVLNLLFNSRNTLNYKFSHLGSFKYLAPFILSVMFVSLFNGIPKYSSIIYYCASIIIPLIIFWSMSESVKSIEAIFLTLFLAGIGMSLFGLFEVT